MEHVNLHPDISSISIAMPEMSKARTTLRRHFRGCARLLGRILNSSTNNPNLLS